MKILILNGNQDNNHTDFDEYIRILSKKLNDCGHELKVLNLRSLDIKYCTGCFNCWVKNPGKCVIKDDTYSICYEYIHSDLVFFASPLIMGFTSALLKKVCDRLIPILLYHIELVDQECHHVARYDKYPSTALLIEKEEDTDEEDLFITSEIYRRFSINFKAELSFTRTTESDVDEVINEINSI